MNDHGTPTDAATLHADAPAHDVLRWRAVWKVEKYDGDWTAAQLAAADAPAPYEVIEREGNLLMYGGVSCLWQCLIGNGTGTAAQTLTYFNNGNAYIGVGDSTTAAAATQTDLQAATNKLRKAMDATYPQHTDATSSGAAYSTEAGSGARLVRLLRRQRPHRIDEAGVERRDLGRGADAPHRLARDEPRFGLLQGLVRALRQRRHAVAQ